MSFTISRWCFVIDDARDPSLTGALFNDKINPPETKHGKLYIHSESDFGTDLTHKCDLHNRAVSSDKSDLPNCQSTRKR
jgi:hypothetical protein